MKVEQLMTAEVKTCHPGDRLSAAAQIMWDHDCGCVPIVDDEGRALGIVTDRDLCMAAYTQDRKLSELAIGEIMSRDLSACAPTDSIESAEETMKQRQVRRLPVLDEAGRLVGVLSLNDLARIALDGKAGRDRGLTAMAVEQTLAAVGRPRRNGDSISPL